MATYTRLAKYKDSESKKQGFRVMEFNSESLNF